ncbi:sterol 24-C-methyltransferase [Metarhizium acridum CQMa 102]|uniref:Sterol 24-C-methyltransferase n=1 Tax=Metarhizium acridum (strain CQMa 102) TaxID=655827 RepID=E9E333_METAQ|nr:sterol 24-C-methyltransferase [Metarhizium acridum CQMa 102]EFY89628.1 sterol 24-C-methyltransferase [Metarhizium acridum CQMa 102]
MPSKTLVSGNDARRADFDKILHGASSESPGGLRAMMGKDREANEVAVKEYFRHWDNKKAQDEAEAVRQARADDYASLTRQYGLLATPFLHDCGIFGVYEWLMTESYDDEDLEHRRIRLDIEQGDGIPQMFGVREGLAAIREAGFELVHHEDFAALDSGPGVVAHAFLQALEMARIVPSGTSPFFVPIIQVHQPSPWIPDTPT